MYSEAGPAWAHRAERSCDFDLFLAVRPRRLQRTLRVLRVLRPGDGEGGGQKRGQLYCASYQWTLQHPLYSIHGYMVMWGTSRETIQAGAGGTGGHLKDLGQRPASAVGLHRVLRGGEDVHRDAPDVGLRLGRVVGTQRRLGPTTHPSPAAADRVWGSACSGNNGSAGSLTAGVGSS